MKKITSDNIIAIIAHDLKDPLTSISGISQVLLDNWKDFTDGEKIEIVNDILDSSDSTLRLLSDLLEWSKHISEISGPVRKLFDAGHIIRDACKPARRKEKWKNIVIENRVSPGIQLFEDENLFAAMFRNLLSNAVKSCPNGGKIEISAETKDQEILFCIADDGVGMSSSRLDALFSKKKNSGQGNGNGFGLILCCDFAELNGGKIWAESKEGEGTSVHFTVPVQIP